jgi:hypothetical protein
MKATAKATIVSAELGNSPKLAPVTRIDSPRAMMMNR